jgi:hypothetical protein
VTKFVAKFRKNSDDYEFTNQYSKNKKKKNKIRQARQNKNGEPEYQINDWKQRRI